MSQTKMVFQRLEKKYIITQAQRKLLLEKVGDKLKNDIFDASTICNIYFDTDQYFLINTSIQKPPYKEKLRLRSYGIPNSNSLVYLEIKKKYKGIVNKRRISLTLSQAQELLKNNTLPKESTQILSELAYFIKYYQPKPKVFIAYERNALIGSDDNELRITFDSQLRRRYDELDFTYGSHGKLLLNPDQVLMEIKAANAYPLWLTHVLSDMKVYPTSFSKYGTAYMNDMVKEKKLILSKGQSYGETLNIDSYQQKEAAICLQAY